METLPSGLPSQIDDGEDLARFLTSDRFFKVLADETVVKPAAFLPRPMHNGTSVYRHGSDPLEVLRQLGQNLNVRELFGAAIIKAEFIRSTLLKVAASEPPPRHADISGWAIVSEDPDEERARRIATSLLLTEKAKVILFR